MYNLANPREYRKQPLTNNAVAADFEKEISHEGTKGMIKPQRTQRTQRKTGIRALSWEKLRGSAAACWHILTAEMKRYEDEISSTVHFCCNAPSGYHYDCVIALALANQARRQAGNVGMMAWLAGGSGKR